MDTNAMPVDLRGIALKLHVLGLAIDGLVVGQEEGCAVDIESTKALQLQVWDLQQIVNQHIGR